jgi:hypothetical protein
MLSFAPQFFLVLVGKIVRSLQALFVDSGWTTHCLATLVRIHGETMAFKNFIWDMAMFVFTKTLVNVACQRSSSCTRSRWQTNLAMLPTSRLGLLLRSSPSSHHEDEPTAENRQTKSCQKLVGFCLGRQRDVIASGTHL